MILELLYFIFLFFAAMLKKNVLKFVFCANLYIIHTHPHTKRRAYISISYYQIKLVIYADTHTHRGCVLMRILTGVRTSSLYRTCIPKFSALQHKEMDY
jgi:hypothetical protein